MVMVFSGTSIEPRRTVIDVSLMEGLPRMTESCRWASFFCSVRSMVSCMAWNHVRNIIFNMGGRYVVQAWLWSMVMAGDTVLG